jgi:hypothetical protein
MRSRPAPGSTCTIGLMRYRNSTVGCLWLVGALANQVYLAHRPKPGPPSRWLRGYFKLPPSACSFVQFCGSLSAKPLQTVLNPSCETRSQGSERVQDAQSGMAVPNSALSRQVGFRLEDFGRSPRFKRIDHKNSGSNQHLKLRRPDGNAPASNVVSAKL